MQEQCRSPLKLKAIMLSNDGGRTWSVIRQYYLVDLRTGQFLDEELLGTRLATMKGDEDHDKQHQPTGS